MSVEHQINFLCVVYAMFFFFINKLKNKNKTMHNVMDMKEKMLMCLCTTQSTKIYTGKF